jgi:hypothetical protein
MSSSPTDDTPSERSGASPSGDDATPSSGRKVIGAVPQSRAGGQQHAAEEHRTAHLNDVPANPFCDNTISTSKYTLFSFVPRSLFEQ